MDMAERLMPMGTPTKVSFWVAREMGSGKLHTRVAGLMRGSSNKGN